MEPSLSQETSRRPTLQAPKKKRKWPRRVIVLAVAVVAVILLLRACTKSAGRTISSAYLPVTVTRQDLSVTVKGTGAISPKDTCRPTALLKADVLEAPFQEGDVVEAGAVLYRLDPADGEEAVRSAESGVERAQLSLDQAQMSYDDLLENQRDGAENAQLKASAAGTIAKLYVAQGDTVAAGTPVASILDRDTLELTVPFHSVDAAGFSVGQSAQVTLVSGGGSLDGVISEIGGVDSVIAGGARVREVVIRVQNPGALTQGDGAVALVGDAASAQAGTFAFAQSKELLAPTSGKLETLLVREGDKVAKDQVVGAFEAPDLASQIDAAALSVRQAQLALQDAQRSLDRAREGLEDYVITAPRAGTVIEKSYDVGDSVDPGAPLALLYDLSELTFDMSISELDIAQLQAGQSVTFTTSALEDRVFSGVLTKISLNGIVQNGSTSYPVTVTVDGGQGLYPGMNVSATILVQELGEALTLPVDAIQRGNEVYVAGEGALNEEGELVDPTRLETREVTLGRNDSENIEIRGGLQEGDTVFVPNNSSNLFAQMMQMGGGM